VTRIELNSGHSLARVLEILDDAVVAQVPNLDTPVRGTCGDPLAVRTLPNRVDLFGMLAECGDALLLPLIPNANLGISSSCEEIRV